MDEIDRISAEAAGEISKLHGGTLTLSGYLPSMRAIIKSAIEKATEPWKQRYELALSDSQRRGEQLDRAAHASEQGAELLEVCQRILNSGELRFDLENALATALSQHPTPATASEDRGYPSDQQILCDDKPDSAAASECTCDNANGLHWGRCPINLKRKPESAAASEIVPAGEVEGKYHGQFDMKPDSASTGILGKMAEDYANTMPETAATPSGGGEWTNRAGAIYTKDGEYIGAAATEIQAGIISVAHNAALRDLQAKLELTDGVYEKLEAQFLALRDCETRYEMALRDSQRRGELLDQQSADTKRLDYADKNDDWLEAHVNQAKPIREAIDAAMLETGEQKVDWLRASAGPTEEQQTGEQTKEKE